MNLRATRTRSLIAAAGVTVVLAAGIAGFATVDSGSSAAPVPLDLAVVTTHAGS